ncbi:DNA-J related domain-containing protein [Colwellia sp. E2M01]|uniref:DNA-J related domain-containing protein n=1 Tax=Colwellia sp. E2M01 TaxID=2841561 RepID=UPI001C09D7C8|nr:DNA-J related domain-containing protein [Colwellia sp. E2M01]MBU2869869.1 DnaJ domain-containing protein [Colwellia sp. E2M01]
MANPLIIPILGYLKQQKCACSLLDLVDLCQSDLASLIGEDVEPQIALFQKNFLIMNALYQIQRDIQSEGFLLNIFPMQITLTTNNSDIEYALTSRDSDLGDYYLDWGNLNNVTAEEVDELFASFWKRYNAVDKTESALASLELTLDVTWTEVRQAYLKKIAICHPDKGGNTEDFIAIREAYEVLSVNYQRA